MTEGDQAVRAAENQSLFRTVNERIAELNRTFDMLTPYGSWACECAQLSCIQRVDMTLAEYTAMRADPIRFAVAPADEHVIPDVEQVVERTDRYWIVEKTGAAAGRARELAAAGSHS
jgi:hypothetical protein